MFKKPLFYYLKKTPIFIISKIIYWLRNVLTDKQYLSLLYRLRMGYWMDFNNPKTFNEKLQWLKLYYRKPEYTQMVDKFAVKEYVANIIGSEYIIPTIGIWDKPENIDWDSLPEQFVLKTTHSGGSTGVVICNNKKTFDRQKAIEKLNKSLKQCSYNDLKEWPYKNVQKRVIAEKYIEPDQDSKDLSDYKFFCFDGEVKALFIATDRQKPNEDVKFDFFDANFNHLPFKQGHENASVIPQKPRCFDTMKMAAAQLSKGIPHARIDFYEVNNRVLFGEITFFHFSGLVPFQPQEWDKTFGGMLKLPNS